MRYPDRESHEKMRFMKRVLCSALCLVALFAFAGCGDSSDDNSGGSGGSGATGGSAGSNQGGSGGSQSGGSGGSNSGGSSNGGSSNGGSANGGSSSGDAEPANMNGMTAAHNNARDNVNPPAATPIPHLTWSSDIEAVAQAWANGCKFEHSMGEYGENLYANSGSTATPQEVVDSWVSEVNDYNYAANSCSNVCGHYTQVVWADTQRLGCAMKTCTENSPFGSGSWDLWVCNYDPPGNYVGEKPY